MDVELSAALFSRDDGEALLYLMSIFAFGLSRRHRVTLADCEPQMVVAWAKRMGGLALADVVRTVLDDGSATLLRSQIVQVGEGAYSIEDACTLLGHPFRVLLENGRTDRGVLLAFSDSRTRKAFEEAEQRGWLEFEHGGALARCTNASLC